MGTNPESIGAAVGNTSFRFSPHKPVPARSFSIPVNPPLYLRAEPESDSRFGLPGRFHQHTGAGRDQLCSYSLFAGRRPTSTAPQVLPQSGAAGSYQSRPSTNRFGVGDVFWITERGSPSLCALTPSVSSYHDHPLHAVVSTPIMSPAFATPFVDQVNNHAIRGYPVSRFPCLSVHRYARYDLAFTSPLHSEDMAHYSPPVTTNITPNISQLEASIS
jgi:hypothetical protein